MDLDGGAPLPDVDLLFWMDPAPVDAARLDELERLLERGRTVVVAASRNRAVHETPMAGLDTLSLRRTVYDGTALWGRFGLQPYPGLVFDERCLAAGPEGPAFVFRVNSIANNQDFHALAFEPNGNLIFELPTPLALDRDQLEAGGWTAEVLATSSDMTWTQRLESDPAPLIELQPKLGESLPKQPLVTWLRPSDPWRGSLVACASSSPFRDAFFGAPGTAHERLAQVLLDSFAGQDRLVLTRAELDRPDPLPPLAGGARVGWRLLCVLLVPVLLLLVAWRRRAPRSASNRRLDLSWVPGLLGRVGPTLVVLLLAVGLSAAWGGGQLALGADGLGGLHPRTAELAREVTADGRLEAELLVSETALLPPELRADVARLTDLLRDLGRAGAEVSVTRTYPERLDADAQAALAAEGVEPTRLTSRREEATEVRTVWSSLRLSAGGRSELLHFADAAAWDDLEFRVAFALHRLATGRRPHVAFASDTPRLSAAERHRYYQTQGLIAPLGKDEYSLARAILERVDFRVTHVDPQRPELPDDLDALVWLQPRRPAERMLERLVEYLYRGGHALLAAQHFTIQPQQFKGANFDFVYWPRPQTNDLERYWLPDFGVDLVREVLFDELAVPLQLESQVNATEKRAFREMRSALPFNLRAVGAHFSRDDVVTRRLGDQAFLWSSFLEWDDDALAAAGLELTPVLTTSPRSWAYAWTGGFLPDALLQGDLEALAAGDPDADPAAAEAAAEEAAKLRPRQTRVLGARLRGQFPWPTVAFTRGGAEDDAPPPEPVDEAAPGELLLLACSEVFKDVRLTELAPEYRGDQLLLNAVASLALDEGLADVLARRPVARGFDPPPPDSRLRWRGLVVFGAPAAYLLLGLVRGVTGGRRRPGRGRPSSGGPRS